MRFRSISLFFLRQVQFLKAEATGVVLEVSFFWQCKANPAIAILYGQTTLIGGLMRPKVRRNAIIYYIRAYVSTGKGEHAFTGVYTAMSISILCILQ